MKRKFLWCSIIAISLFTCTNGQSLPKFEEYAVPAEKIAGTKVDLKDASSDKATGVRKAIAKGVNFAGRYILAPWSYRTTTTAGIINAKTGQMFLPPELDRMATGGLYCNMPDMPDLLEYKPNSKLLIIRGVKGGDFESGRMQCGVYYYEWTGGELKLIKAVTVQKVDDITSWDRVDPEKIPRTGAKKNDFIPAGWQSENEVAGDLNGDGTGDMGLTIKQGKVADDRQPGRALIVLFGEKDGSWKKAAVADRLLRCVSCGGPTENIKITVKEGVLAVYQKFGETDEWFTADLKFRFEPAMARFRLVETEFTTDKGGASEISNYVTGQRKFKIAKGNLTPEETEPDKIYLDGLDFEALLNDAWNRLLVRKALSVN